MPSKRNSIARLNTPSGQKRTKSHLIGQTIKTRTANRTKGRKNTAIAVVIPGV